MEGSDRGLASCKGEAYCLEGFAGRVVTPSTQPLL